MLSASFQASQLVSFNFNIVYHRSHMYRHMVPGADFRFHDLKLVEHMGCVEA